MPPRRMRGDGSVHQRGDGLYVGQIDLGWVDGKRKRRTVYGRTQDEARKKLERAKRDRDAGVLTTATMTVEKWLGYWLDEIAAPHVKPRTLRTYRTYVETHLVPTLGRRRLDRLEPQHIRDLHRRVLDGHSSTTALHAHRILSTALEAARKDGRVVRNVATLVHPPARAEKVRDGLTVEEAKAVLTAAGNSPTPARWQAALLTGARQGEILGLRWDYVDLDAGLADVAWSLQRVPYTHGCGPRPAKGKEWTCQRRFGSSCTQRRLDLPAGMEHVPLHSNLYLLRPKTKGSRRIVPLFPALASALRTLRDTDPHPNPHGLVWHREDGRPVDPRNDWKAWRELLEAAGVEATTLHETRDTTATLLLEANVDPHVIASMLGHSSIVTTRGYQKVSVELKRRAIGQLGAQLGIT